MIPRKDGTLFLGTKSTPMEDEEFQAETRIALPHICLVMSDPLFQVP